MKKWICDFLNDVLYRMHAEYIPYEDRFNKLTKVCKKYTSAQLVDYMAKKLSLIKNDQNPEYADTWFSAKTIHEEDYKLFSFFKKDDYMILDIGANAGYSVSSMYSAGVRCPIFSFEANEMHRRNLERIKNKIAPQYGFTYDYAILGLSDKAGKTSFLMPVINRVIISGLVRMQLDDIQLFCKHISDHIKNYYSEQKVYFSIVRFESPLNTLDSYIEKNPSKFTIPIAAIKIDTEGTEYNILRGSINTIQKFHPLILVEGDTILIREFLAKQGYRSTAYCDGKLYFNKNNIYQNTAYVHEEYIQRYSDIGLIGN